MGIRFWKKRTSRPPWREGVDNSQLDKLDESRASDVVIPPSIDEQGVDSTKLEVDSSHEADINARPEQSSGGVDLDDVTLNACGMNGIAVAIDDELLHHSVWPHRGSCRSVWY